MTSKHQSTSLFTRILPIAIIVLASCFYVYEFMLRVMPSVMKQDLMLSFNVAASGFGVIGSLFYWGYVPMQIPAGLLYDRFSTRTLLSIAVFLCGLGAIIFGLATNFLMVCVGRWLIGFTSSFAFIGCLVLTARWFHAKYFTLITGVIQFMGSFGAIFGAAPIAFVLQYFTWRNTQLGAGIIGIILSVILWLVIRDRPPEVVNKTKKKLVTTNLTEKQRLKKVLSHPQTWWAGICAFAAWTPMTLFSAWWGVNYLTKYYDISMVDAGQAITFIWLGNAFASPVIGWWSNRINSRRIPIITSAFLATISSLVVLFVPHLSWGLMCLSLCVLGAAASSHAITFGIVQDNMPPEVAGTAVGFNNMMVVLGGMVLTPVVGFVLDRLWDGTLESGLHSYSILNYQWALVVIPICGLVGLIVSIFFVKETHCQPQYDLKMP